MKTITTINTAIDTFLSLIEKTNELCNTISTEVLTANNNANGAYVTGNSYLNGIFGANTLTVFNALRGGNVQSSNVLLITSNVLISDSKLTVGNSTINTVANSTSVSVGANVIVSTTDLKIGNSTVNSFANSTLVQVSNSTAVANLIPNALTIGTSIVNSTSIAVGANVIVSTTDLKIGNSTVNSTTNSSALTIGTSIVNSTAHAVGANVIVSTTDLKIGNSTVNSFANSTLVQVSNSTAIANLAPNALIIGTSVVNSTSIAVGSNVVISTADLKIGNSTVNAIVNSTSVYINGTSIHGVTVSNNNIIIGNRPEINFIGGTNISFDITDYEAGGQVNVQISASVTNASAYVGGANTQVQFNDNSAFGGTAGFTFTKTSNTLAVGNTITSNNFSGNNVSVVQMTVNNSIVHTSIERAFVTSVGPDLIDSFAIATYRSGEYFYSIKNDAANAYQTGRVLILNDGTNGHTAEYAIAISNTSLGSFNASQNSTHILMRFTPVSSLSYTVKSTKTLIPV